VLVRYPLPRAASRAWDLLTLDDAFVVTGAASESELNRELREIERGTVPQEPHTQVLGDLVLTLHLRCCSGTGAVGAGCGDVWGFEATRRAPPAPPTAQGHSTSELAVR
jgi:hypothetical protein